MNPLDYKIADPDAMRYALMNDAGYKKGGQVKERIFDEQDKGDWFNKKGERRLPQGDKKIRSPLLRPPKGTRFPVTDPKMEKDFDFSSYPIKKVPVDDLYSIQNNVREDNLKPERKHGKPIHVVIWKGKYWVVDGNHRASEFWAAGEKNIHAHVLNLDDHPEMEKKIFGGVKKMATGGQVTQDENPSKGGFLEEAYKELIPAHIRTFAETLGGERSPITETNFSKSEQDQMKDAILNSRKDRTATNNRLYNEQLNNAKSDKEAMELVKRGPSKDLDQTVGYQHYPGGEDHSVRRDSDIGYDAAVRNTLGRFAYSKDPQGNLIVTDNYKFTNDLPNETRPTSDYEGMSAVEKLKTLALDTLHLGGPSSFLSRVGNAFIGSDGRPVQVNLGPAPFAAGGAVSFADSLDAMRHELTRNK